MKQRFSLLEVFKKPLFVTIIYRFSCSFSFILFRGFRFLTTEQEERNGIRGTRRNGFQGFQSTILLGLFLCGSVFVISQERYVMPVDEARKDASFLAFRTKLIAAAERRDAKQILGILDRNIMNSFGGSGGIAEFKKMWRLSSANSKFWKEFHAVLSNGGTFLRKGRGPKQFWAPYTFASFPDDLDAFEYQAIFGSNVKLRERAATDSSVVTMLSHNIIKADYKNSIPIGDEIERLTWIKVETLGGRKGYVKAEYIRSPIDYRAGFEKKQGIWKMVAFIAGD